VSSNVYIFTFSLLFLNLCRSLWGTWWTRHSQNGFLQIEFLWCFSFNWKTRRKERMWHFKARFRM